MAVVGTGEVRELAATVVVEGDAIEGTGFASPVVTKTKTTCGRVSVSPGREAIPTSIGRDCSPRSFPQIVPRNTIAARDYSAQSTWLHVPATRAGGVLAS